MVGSTIDGIWNQTEAVSLMIKSVDTLHALPDLQEVRKRRQLIWMLNANRG